MMSMNTAPIMLVGQHGIGKSEFVAQAAAALGYHLLDIRLSQYSEGDILGIPYPTEHGTTRFRPPDLFHVASTEPCVLFLDELNRATKEVRQAVFQLADSHRLGSLDVHPQTIVISACNPDDANYDVHTLDPAELDRWFVFPFQPTVDEWLDWATYNKINVAIIEYIRQNPHDLDPDTLNGSVVNGPSRRSWARFSRTMEKFVQTRGELKEDMVLFMAQGFVGREVSNNFMYFYKEFNKVNLFEKILLGAVSTIDPVDAAVHLAQDVTINGRKVSAKYCGQPSIVRFVKFLKTLPPEVRDATWKSVKKNCVREFVEAAESARKAA